jgi:uncharacterized membrane protein
MAFVLALWILILVIQLATWAWPVTLGIFGLAIVGSLLSLIGRRGRILRRRSAEIDVARRNAASQLVHERRHAEGRMWEEFGRHIRGESE